MWNRVCVWLDLREESGKRHHLDDSRPRDEPVLSVDRGHQPVVVVIALEALEESKVVFQ